MNLLPLIIIVGIVLAIAGGYFFWPRTWEQGNALTVPDENSAKLSGPWTPAREQEFWDVSEELRLLLLKPGNGEIIQSITDEYGPLIDSRPIELPNRRLSSKELKQLLWQPTARRR